MANRTITVTLDDDAVSDLMRLITSAENESDSPENETILELIAEIKEKYPELQDTDLDFEDRHPASWFPWEDY